MNREHKWEISVSSGSYYQSLCIEFSGGDIGLSFEDDHMGMQCFAYSYHVDELSDPKAVSKRLYSLQILLNGALNVYSGKTGVPTTFTEFFDINSGGRESVWADSIEEYPFSKNPKIDQFRPDRENPSDYLPSYLIHLARKDENIRSLLFLCGLISTNSTLENILTWSTLYKITDSVKYYSRQEGISMKALVNTGELNKFTAACNNMSILGINARHGAKGNNAPTRVITDIGEAIKLVLRMANKFAHAYTAKKYP